MIRCPICKELLMEAGNHHKKHDMTRHEYRALLKENGVVISYFNFGSKFESKAGYRTTWTNGKKLDGRGWQY